MPTFRVSGQVRVPFIHEVEAPTAQAAVDIVENTRLEGIDNADTTMGETEVGEVLLLDADGNEV